VDDSVERRHVTIGRRALSYLACVTIPRAGHLANLESPDAFNEAMRGWLDAVARAAARQS
jgi:pimeloyl-ACP methyl ester carboxylesterase